MTEPKFKEGDLVLFKIQSPNELAASHFDPHANQFYNKWRSAIISDPKPYSPDRQDPPPGFVWIAVLTDDEALFRHFRVPEAVLRLASEDATASKPESPPDREDLPKAPSAPRRKK